MRMYFIRGVSYKREMHGFINSNIGSRTVADAKMIPGETPPIGLLFSRLDSGMYLGATRSAISLGSKMDLDSSESGHYLYLLPLSENCRLPPCGITGFFRKEYVII